MRRERVEPRPVVELLLERWRKYGDPRAAEHAAGESVFLSVDELPAGERFGHDEADPQVGFPDDLELLPDGEFQHSYAYYGRLLDIPPPYRGAAALTRPPEKGSNP